MRQKSIGEVLRAARESRGWTFTEVQRMTKVQAKYLQALEYNDFNFIPDQDYTRSFLQRYAEILELDADVLLDAYDNNSLIAYYEAGEEEDFEMRRSNKVKKTKASYLPLIYLLLAATFIFIFVVYVVYGRVQNQARMTNQTSSYSVVSQSTSTVSSTTSSSSTETSTSSSTTSAGSTTEDKSVTLTATGSDANLAVTVKGATAPIEIKLTATDTTSWISLTDSSIASGVVLSSDNPSVTTSIPEGITTATLTLGVVKGVQVTVAGKALDLSALTAQTGYITFTIE